MQEVITWGALLVGIATLVAVIKFWIDITKDIGAAKAVADAAITAASVVKEELSRLKAKSEALDLQLLAMSGSFALHREQIARDYINRDTLREAEARITQAIERLGDRLDRVFEART